MFISIIFYSLLSEKIPSFILERQKYIFTLFYDFTIMFLKVWFAKQEKAAEIWQCAKSKPKHIWKN